MNGHNLTVAMVRDHLLTQAFAYGDRAERTPYAHVGGIAIVEQYARNLRAAAMTYYKFLADHEPTPAAERVASSAFATDLAPTDPDIAAQAIGSMLDAAFALGAGALFATIIADPAGVREQAFIAWATARKFPVEVTDGIRDVTLRTLYVRFPGKPHPIASLQVPTPIVLESRKP
jgi:hypothetical protein